MIFFIFSSILLVALAIVLVYHIKNKKPEQIEYIWVGPGEDPFKDMKN